MPSRRARRGVALPMVLLVITILAAAGAAAFMSTTSEIVRNSAQRGVYRSYTIAQSGLEQFLVRRAEAGWCQHCTLTGATAPPKADSEWTRVTTPYGYADVVTRLVHAQVAPTDAAIYFISSIGTDTSSHLSGGEGNVKAERMVGVYASWPPKMSVLAAWEGLAGITDTLSSIVLNGVDQCNNGADSVAGVTTPTNTWKQTVSMAPVGKPPYDTTKTLAQVAAETHIDWKGIEAGSIPATVDIPAGGSWPAFSPTWSDSTKPWPIIRIHGSPFTIPAVNNEFGTVICDGDCYNMSNNWKGVFLVGGALTADHGNAIYGAAVTGLNLLTGGNPGRSLNNASGNTMQYNSCAVSSALQRLQPTVTYAPFSNTWMDNIAIY